MIVDSSTEGKLHPTATWYVHVLWLRNEVLKLTIESPVIGVLSVRVPRLTEVWLSKLFSQVSLGGPGAPFTLVALTVGPKVPSVGPISAISCSRAVSRTSLCVRTGTHELPFRGNRDIKSKTSEHTGMQSTRKPFRSPICLSVHPCHTEYLKELKRLNGT